MSIFRLKRKNFALLADGSGRSISDFKADYKKAGGANGSAITNANNKIAKDTATRSAQRARNIANPGAAAAKSAFSRGQASVGIKQGALNTWNRMGKMGKAGTIAAGATGAYLLGKGLFGGNKDK